MVLFFRLNSLLIHQCITQVSTKKSPSNAILPGRGFAQAASILGEDYAGFLAMMAGSRITDLPTPFIKRV